MRRSLALCAAVMTLGASAVEWSGKWKTLQAKYVIYSGELAERDAPTAIERTMTIALEGSEAKDVFESIGPDIHPTCSGAKGDRERRKRGVMCVFSSSGAAKGYRCWIGLNLRTGESVATVSC